MLTAVKYALIPVILLFHTGCVDLFYAKDFTGREFVRDHIKEPFVPLTDALQQNLQ